MSLEDDLAELSLAVPDAPTLPDRLLEEAAKHAQAVADLLGDAAQWKAEAEGLARDLTAEVTRLGFACERIQEVVAAGTEAVSDSLKGVLAALETNGVSLSEHHRESVASLDAVTVDLSAWVSDLASIGADAAAAAAVYAEEVETMRAKLESTAAGAQEAVAQMASFVSSAAGAADGAASHMADRLTAIASLAATQIQEDTREVRAHLQDAATTVAATAGAYGPALKQLAAQPLTEAKDARTGMEEDMQALEASAREALASVHPMIEALADARASLAEQQGTFAEQRSRLGPLVDAAQRAEKHVGR